MSAHREKRFQMDGAGHQAVRLLIASYFIAIALGILPSDNGIALMSAFVPDKYAAASVTAFVFATAILIVLGRQVRIAALLLANYVFWTSLVAFISPQTAMSLSEFWRDMVLVGALMLTYTGPALTRRRVMPFTQKVKPRRIVPSHREQRRISAEAMRAQIRKNSARDLPTPLAIVGKQDAAVNRPLQRSHSEEDNIFSSVYETTT
ncbi:MAG: hypothetical protein ABJO67_09475 [Pseudoruegeria sp.]